MRLLRCDTAGRFSLTKDLVGNDTIPPYAILSHTWTEGQEVTFQDLAGGTGEGKSGYDKLRFCAERAAEDGLHHFWVDTCCIDKSNPSEVSRDINAMFRYYRNAVRCYVYLPDVSHPASGTKDEHNQELWEIELRKCRWFTRGWTLQELLAPCSVVFFACKPTRSPKYERLGDRSSLQQLIHEVTGIPIAALAGSRLSLFGIEERFMWSERRKTEKPEDKFYSLLGIFDVEIPLLYGEGATQAYIRLEKVLDKREKCMRDLRTTDPREDKKRIERVKGGLLENAYCWILKNHDFVRWLDAEQHAVLWIKGDLATGKTMLLCSVINELEKSIAQSTLLCYFFCQAMDQRINSATAVLRGLIYMLVDQQPSLATHMQKKYDRAGKKLFEDPNAWFALAEVLENIVNDPGLNITYAVIDGLNECVEELPKLLHLIAELSTASHRVKWILSSRNEVFQPEELPTVTIQLTVTADWSECWQTLKGHSEMVLSLDISGDSQWIVTASCDKTAKIWAASSGKCVHTLKGHNKGLTSAAISGDSQWVVTGSDDTTAKLWKTHNGQCVRTFDGHSNVVTSVAISRDGERIVTASWDWTAKIWEASSGKCIQTLNGHKSMIMSVAMSDDSQWVVTGSVDSTAKIWKAHSGKCLWTLVGHSYEVAAVTISDDSQWIVTGSLDTTAKIWERSSGKCVQTLQDHKKAVSSVAIAGGSRWVVTGSHDLTAKIWDANVGKCVQTLENNIRWVTSVAISGDSRWVLTGSNDIAKLWKASKEYCVQTLDDHSIKLP